jgi:hypothetical protein
MSDNYENNLLAYDATLYINNDGSNIGGTEFNRSADQELDITETLNNNDDG